MEYFSRLPVEITVDILSRLPTELVLECKTVAKTWNNLVSHHPSFSEIHLHHLNHPSNADSGKFGFLAKTNIGRAEKLHYFEYDENQDSTPILRIRRISFTPPFKWFVLIGSSNGLICLARCPCFPVKIDPPVCICNPINKDFVMLPEIKRDGCDTDENYNWVSGFGYVSSTNEYKVVGISKLKNGSYEVQIYTLGSGIGWRNLGVFNFGIFEYWAPGIFANGALYWMSTDLEMIVTFDLAEEKFCKHISPPPLPEEGVWVHNRIGVLDGFLSLSVSLLVEATRYYDVWLLKKKNDNGGKKEGEEHHSFGWSKVFRVDESKLLAITKSDSVLTYNDNYLNIYDTSSSTSKRLVNLKEQFLQVFPHKSTLVSLKELGEEGTQIIEPQKTELMISLPISCTRRMRP